MTISRATEDAAAALGALLAESHALHADALPWRFRTQTVAEAEQRARELVPASSRDGAPFVADEDRAVIGAIRFNVVVGAPTLSLAARRYVFVQELAVAPSHQHRGSGRALMGQAERWAEEQGITEVERNVFAFNRGAVAFLETLGCTAIQHRMRRRLR